jgi:hypothetical protein
MYWGRMVDCIYFSSNHVILVQCGYLLFFVVCKLCHVVTAAIFKAARGNHGEIFTR